MAATFPTCDKPGCRKGRRRWSRFCVDHHPFTVSHCPECGSEYHLLCNRRELAKAQDRAFLEYVSEQPELTELEKRWLDGDR